MKEISGTMAQMGTPGLETRLDIPIVIARMGKDLRFHIHILQQLHGDAGPSEDKAYEAGK
jgi:hypothetical protein